MQLLGLSHNLCGLRDAVLQQRVRRHGKIAHQAQSAADFGGLVDKFVGQRVVGGVSARAGKKCVVTEAPTNNARYRSNNASMSGSSSAAHSDAMLR